MINQLPPGWRFLGSRITVSVLTSDGQLIEHQGDSKEEALTAVFQSAVAIEQQKAAMLKEAEDALEAAKALAAPMPIVEPIVEPKQEKHPKAE